MATQTVRHYPPRVFVPGTSVLLLTEARKMPCNSWSLPALEACPWKVTDGEGAICGDCYANKGSYTQYPAVKRAQRARFDWTRESLKTEAGTDAFVGLMVATIRSTRNEYFRVHDSGDLFSPDYVRAWVRICRALPEVRFWFPTRSWRPLLNMRLPAESRDRWALALCELAGLANVTVRPSALFFNAPAPRVPGLHAGSTATDAGFNCPAPLQGNACGDCRACWLDRDTPISYHRH